MGSALKKLGAATGELAAYAKQALLLRHDVGAPVVPSDTAHGDAVVVCLHGLFATAGVLRPLRHALEANDDVHTATLSYPAGLAVRPLARRVAELLSELPRDVEIHLLGHSLGGIVMRYFAQEMGDPRVVQTISLASPFGGVGKLAWTGLELTRDMAPGSTLLRKLQLGSRRAVSLPHLSIVGGSDHVVTPPAAHTLVGGDVIIVRNCGHNALLYDKTARAAVVDRVLQLRPRARQSL